MRNTITLNGQSSGEISGLLIQSLPPISKPAIRTEIEQIDGRDGDIVTSLGYSAYDKSFTIGLYGDFDINQVIAFFNSKGTVIFSNEPDKYYYYEINDQIDFERLIRFRTATVTMHCQPFKYSSTEGDIVLDPAAPNLLNIPDFTKTTNGLTLTVSSGEISVSGTPSAATEFYVPTGGLNLSEGAYTLSAQAIGTRVESSSIRLIGSSPSNADSFGGNYVGLKNAQTVTINGTQAPAKTFNYLWFYINASGAIDFTMGATVESQADKVVSGEGTMLVLPNTSEAPFNRFDIKGDTFQQTYSGKNLFNIPSLYSISVVTESISLPAGTYHLTYRAVTRGGNDNPVIVIQQPSSPVVIQLLETTNDYIFTITSDADTVYLYSNGWNYQASIGVTSTVEDLMISTSGGAYEPYVGVIPSPNPDYPQPVQVVKHQNMFRLTGKNLVTVNELDLPNTIERTANGLRAEITATPLLTYYSGSTTNPLGVFTVSFDARTPNADEAGLVLDTTAEIWGQSGLVLKDKDGYPADEYYRTLGKEWSRFSFTVVASTSAPWTDTQAMKLNFDTYTNTPIFELKDLQIEAGLTATEFDPSLPQLYPIDFRTGKNLLSVDFLIMGGLQLGMPTPEAYRVNNAFSPTKVSPNTTYTISANLGSTIQGLRVGVQECDINTVYISDNGWQQLASGAYTFTTGDSTEYVKLVFSLSTTSDTVDDSNEDVTEFALPSAWLRGTTLQVEQGDTATAYEPYESIELCKIGNYQDYISKRGDDWYVHKEVKKIVLDGSEEYTQVVENPNATDYYYVSTAKYDNEPIMGSYTDELSNRFTNYGTWFLWNTAVQHDVFSFMKTGEQRVRFMIKKSRLSAGTINAMKDFARQNPIEIYYSLATPTETRITNPYTIYILEALHNQAHAYKDVTYITSIPSSAANLPAITAVEIVKSSDGVVTNAGNFPAKPRLTVYGTGDIGITLNGNQLFQITLGNEEYITIDTATMEAYKDSTDNLKNRLVTGDYDNFALNSGENQITFTGVVTKCIVENYSRWL